MLHTCSFFLRRIVLCLLFLAVALAPLAAQKMLLLERAGSAKTTKMYIGDVLRYRLNGKEDYWYESVITDILPEKNVILLDNFATNVDSIYSIKVHRRPITRLAGGALFTFGSTLTFATTVAALYRDEYTNYGALYGTAAASLGTGLWMSMPRKLKLGKKFRLRPIEIDFGPQPEKQN